MHGTILLALKKYAVTRWGAAVWPEVLHEAALDTRVYLAVQEYPDDEARRLLSVCAKRGGGSPQVVLEDFGAFLAGNLLALYSGYLRPGWKTLDVIEHTENTIHCVVRRQHAHARPPEIQAVREAPNRVIVQYGSKRRMCPLARGIVRGIADHFKEIVLVKEPQCMLLGHEHCTMVITKIGDDERERTT